MRPLDGVHAKLYQARRHFEIFYEAFHAFLKDNPVLLGLKPDTQPRHYIVQVEHIPALPPSLAVIAGDGIHNFRSALDHLVWQLALLQTPGPSRSTQFPIVSEEKDFASQGFRIADLAADHQAMIERHQPYHRGGKTSPLWQLKELSNFDKHRVLNLPFVSPMVVGLEFEGDNCTVDNVTFLSSGYDLHINTEIARLKLEGDFDQPKVQMKGHLVPDVKFEDGESLNLTCLLIGGEVMLLIHEFERILEPRALGVPSPRRWPSFATWPPPSQDPAPHP